MKRPANAAPYPLALIAGLGAATCITLLSGLGRLNDALWLMAPFGATMVILFGLPASPLAQPRNIVCGHLLTTGVGLLVATALGVNAWTLGLAVGLAVTLMLLTDTTHPPAGANPLVVMLTGQDWHFLISPVAIGTLAIVAFGLAYHRLLSRQPYPQRWL
ncbi:HPP family protein [Microbulbifer litoralis]|uniref:HPP family protein n=1 Tax=Microbulbifer litoralis TaxID=2933965 RepID=UPI002027B53B|nr:HPP family protein [Microbulbifer sp. GX H0434]